jgi:Protein of unknown function (DUF3619)
VNDIDPENEEFARRARTLLEESVETLSAHTRSRLTRARHAALEQRGPRAGLRSAAGYAAWRNWLPAGAVAGAVLAVLLLVGRMPAPALQQASVASGEDLELLADRDALALAQDQAAQEGELDYEFYDWAAGTAQDPAGGLGS